MLRMLHWQFGFYLCGSYLHNSHNTGCSQKCFFSANAGNKKRHFLTPCPVYVEKEEERRRRGRASFTVSKPLSLSSSSLSSRQIEEGRGDGLLVIL